MSNEDKMTINERRKYLRMVKKRYIKAVKVSRGYLLSEMEAVTSLHRKSLVRLMTSNLKRKRASNAHKSHYYISMLNCYAARDGMALLIRMSLSAC